ncbi:CBS domain-containing protein [Streptomyces sp. SID2888]|uniref:CBS domain-containing protein n=1 Tax=Streptomyces sp. SID2888 TaxID=2690256 RepID=UPI0031F6E18A
MKTQSIGEVMTSEVVRAHRDTAFKEIVRLLDRHRISGLPVVDRDDKVLGVISGADLVRGQMARGEQGRGHRFRLPALRRATGAPAEEALGTTAEGLMTTPALTVHPEQRVQDAARLMERHRVERLPVVDEEDRLIGIVTRRDLLRVFLRTDEEIRGQVVDDVLVASLGLSPDAVAVSVRDGMVTLEGLLERRSEIPLVVRSAWRVDGVIGVVNSLAFRVDDGPPPARHPSRGFSSSRLPER